MSKDLQAFAKNNKTYMPNPETVERKWYVVDATGLVLGRLASQVAAILKGKNKPTYTPHQLRQGCFDRQKIGAKILSLSHRLYRRS